MIVIVFHSASFHKFISKAEEPSRMFSGREKKKVGKVREKIDFVLITH